MSKTTKLTVEECQRRVSVISQNIVVLDYIGYAKPSHCRCIICGNEWQEPPKNLYRGSNCPICFHRKKTWNTELLIAEIKLINPDVEILGEYRGAHAKILCRCRLCGREWESEPTMLLSNRGCDPCRRKAGTLKLTKTNEQFICEIAQKCPNIIPVEEYAGANIAILVRCAVCNHEWHAQPTNLLSGTGCPACWKERKKYVRRKTHSQFVADVANINPNILVASHYEGAKGIVKLQCKECDTIWECSGSAAVSHTVGCPNCSASHGEKAIYACLNELQIPFVPQKRFDDLIGVGGAKLSYDFYLPQHNVLIEYQGQYHDGSAKLQTDAQYHKQQEHDSRKRSYAATHGYRLLEIWYWDFKNIKRILKEKFLSSDAA